jgi:hypothetical protein
MEGALREVQRFINVSYTYITPNKANSPRSKQQTQDLCIKKALVDLYRSANKELFEFFTHIQYLHGERIIPFFYFQKNLQEKWSLL